MLVENRDDCSAPGESPLLALSSSVRHAESDFAPSRESRLAPVELTALTHDDCEFVTALHDANVALELDGAELTRAAQHARSASGASRRIDLLEAYYDADGDPYLSQRRHATDRWFLYYADDALSAADVVQRLRSITPELGSARLERIGGHDGALILRAGEQVCGLEDDRPNSSGEMTVSVRDVVRAFNVLLERHGIRTRLVGLFGDGRREAYIGQASMGSAMPLATAQYLDVADAEGLMQRTAW